MFERKQNMFITFTAFRNFFLKTILHVTVKVYVIQIFMKKFWRWDSSESQQPIMALLCLSVLWSLWKLSVTVAHNCNNKFILYSRTGTVKSLALYFPHSLSSLSAAQTASQKILSKVIIDLRADRNLKSCKNCIKNLI